VDADRRHQTVLRGVWPDRAIGELAAHQQTLVTHAQLRGLGVSASAISRALGRGRLHRVHRGVYSLVLPSVRPRRAPERAALLVHGAAAVLSHHTAASLHGLGGFVVPEVHVTLVGAERRALHVGIVIHRTEVLHPQERHRLNGLWVTSVARTVLDLCPHLDERPLELLFDEVLVHHKTSRSKLEEALERHPGRAGTARLRLLLDPERPTSWTRSPREERLFQMLRSAKVPMPETNVWLTANYRPDLLWREQRLIVEYDGQEWHMGRRRFHSDRTRHNDLSATEGYQVLHVTKEHTPESVLVWVVQALARGDRR
jgi:predicted transcriptional regulator of viral defense system